MWPRLSQAEAEQLVRLLSKVHRREPGWTAKPMV
jgi:hypothetical protein